MPAPLEGIMQLMMRGNAESQAQAQVKDVASRQADAASKLQVTMTADPNDPGNPHITIKNAKADVLNQTQDQDLQNAYDAPHKNVETAIAAGRTAPARGMTPGEFEDAALSSVGYPAREHVTGKDLQTFDQVYKAQRKLGESPFKAALLAQMRGAFDAEEMANTVNEQEALKRGAAFSHTALPAIQEQDRQQRLDRSEASLAQTVAHQQQVEENAQRRLDDAERTRAQTRKQQVNLGIDYSMIDPGENNINWRKAFDDANDSGVPATPQDYARIERKGAQDVKKFYHDFFIAKQDVYQLGHYPTFDAAKAAYGHAFVDANDEARARNAWSAAHQFTQRQIADDEAKQQNRELRSQLMIQRLEAATAEKPMALSPADVHYMATEELLNTPPEKIKNYDQMLLRKEAQINKDIEEPTRRRYKAAKDRVALMQEVNDASANGATVRDYRVRLASYQADEKIANDEIAKLTADRTAVQAARAARRAGTKPAVPAPGSVVKTKRDASGRIVVSP